jgi:predicted enzyme related to lactoylglutathione lyase
MPDVSHHEPGRHRRSELATSDAAAAKKSYSRLLGWTLKKSPGYTEFQLGEESVGGMMAIR